MPDEAYVMAELLTAAQMRTIEKAAIDSGAVSGIDLMERAGRGVFEAIFEEWPELAVGPHNAAVLCGPGNNGGDGFVVARLLKDWGWQVEVFLYGDTQKLPVDAKTNFDRWGEFGSVLPLDPENGLTSVSKPDLIVDAVFGTGLARKAEDPVATFLSTLATVAETFGAKIVAIDLPSGVCSDSGKVLGTCTNADLTVSFHTEKIGHRLGRADEHSGKIIVKDIGLAADDQSSRSSDVVYKVEMPRQGLRANRRSGHKYSHGHALVLSGGPGKTGAARLAARGALRVGAGLVTLGVPPSAQMEVAGQITAIMLKRIPNADALAAVLEDQRFNAVCLGPGLGVDENARALVRTALKAKRAVVLDADALSVLQIEGKNTLFNDLHENCVLTPHDGEFARVFPDISAKLNVIPTKGPAYSKVDAARDAAKRAGCVVLFKGPDSVIASPDGRCSIHSAHYERAAPWLATAGSGDVLAGFITGLLAQGQTPMQAAEQAAWLHVECALQFGPGLISEDIPEQLPNVFRQMRD
jgi:hydroxyethylthiazole kinase-like uncharacterized protein yjeF